MIIDIRLKQLVELAIDLKPMVREVVEESERAQRDYCLFDLCRVSFKEAKTILNRLIIISQEPASVLDSSFISQKLVSRSGNSDWGKLKGLIELGKR